MLVSSLEDVKSEKDAQKVLDETKPDYVVWSAGKLWLSVSLSYMDNVFNGEGDSLFGLIDLSVFTLDFMIDWLAGQLQGR